MTALCRTADRAREAATPPQTPPSGRRIGKGGAGRTMKGGWLSYSDPSAFALLISAVPVLLDDRHGQPVQRGHGEVA
ncbi:hypothetical protein SBADM41S_09605 [Streptomyces badius]